MAEYSLGEALNKYLNNTPIKGQMQAAQIKEVWETIMGKTIATYTQEIQIRNKQLIITCYAPALKQELMYQKTKIIKRINEWFGEAAIFDIVVY
jgi:predicted nucleic acid-binding Zn ribbon protein